MMYKILGVVIIIICLFVYLALLSILPEIFKLVIMVIKTNNGYHWGELSAYVFITGIIGVGNYYLLKFGIKLSKV